MTIKFFGNDRPLLFDVYPWNEYGFGVASFGDNFGTLSTGIHNLADEIGRAQLYIMTHIDAQRTQPPSPNTVQRLGKIMNRIRSVLASRKREYNELRVEETHATTDVNPWMIHPVPYFGSSVVRNHWLKDYNALTMVALTNIYQHSDNNLSLTITTKFAQDIWVYFNEIKNFVGIELLLLPEADVKADDFVFTQQHYDQYDPEKVTLNYEALDTPGPMQSRKTEDDIRPLFEGIPATIIKPMLKQYPVVDDFEMSGAPLPDAAAAPGVQDGSAVQPPGGTIGQPQV